MILSPLPYYPYRELTLRDSPSHTDIWQNQELNPELGKQCDVVDRTLGWKSGDLNSNPWSATDQPYAHMQVTYPLCFYFPSHPLTVLSTYTVSSLGQELSLSLCV